MRLNADLNVGVSAWVAFGLGLAWLPSRIFIVHATRELPGLGAFDHSTFPALGWPCSAVLHLQNIAVAGDHLVEYRIHEEADEQTGYQASHDDNGERPLCV